MGMNSMFSNFTNIDTTYQPNPFQTDYLQKLNNLIQSVNINKPYEILNADKSLKGYFWYYGNSVDLQFDIDGEVTLLNQDEYITLTDILQLLDVTATIYNFRMEPMLKYSNDVCAEYRLDIDPYNLTIVVKIDNLTSEKLVKGKYYIDLVAKHPSGYNETLFSANTCLFEVR